MNINGYMRPGLRVARVTRYYIGSKGSAFEGETFCDCTDSYGGVWRFCRVINQGAGLCTDPDGLNSLDRWVPPQDVRYGDANFEEHVENPDLLGDVLLAFGESKGAVPPAYVVGTLYTPGVSNEVEIDPEKVKELGKDTNADYGEKVTFTDRLTMHKGVRVVMAANGTYLVDSKRTKQPIRFELAPESWMRVSQENSSEYVLLGNQTLQHLRAVHARLDFLADKIFETQDQLKMWATETTAAVVSAASVTTNTDAIAMALPFAETLATLTANLATSDPTLTDYPYDFSKSGSLGDSDGGSSSYKAACFRISDLSVSAQPEPEET